MEEKCRIREGKNGAPCAQQAQQAFGKSKKYDAGPIRCVRICLKYTEQGLSSELAFHYGS